MWWLLTANVDDSGVWDKLFAYLYDNFLFVADVIWNTKLPLTDISIGYWLIFWMIIRLSIYSVNGASTGYNDLASEVENASTKTYKGIALKTSKKTKVARFNNKESYKKMKDKQWTQKHKGTKNVSRKKAYKSGMREFKKNVRK